LAGCLPPTEATCSSIPPPPSSLCSVVVVVVAAVAAAVSLDCRRCVLDRVAAVPRPLHPTRTCIGTRPGLLHTPHHHSLRSLHLSRHHKAHAASCLPARAHPHPHARPPPPPHANTPLTRLHPQQHQQRGPGHGTRLVLHLASSQQGPVDAQRGKDAASESIHLGRRPRRFQRCCSASTPAAWRAFRPIPPSHPPVALSPPVCHGIHEQLPRRLGRGLRG
jgi:hypothetical protein